MNSFLLFNNRLSLKYSIRCNFSAKQSGQKLIFVLPYTFSTADYLILDFFYDHIYFDDFMGSFVLFMVKIFVMVCKLRFERCFCISKYILVLLFALFSTSDWYIMVILRLDFATASFFSFSSCNHTQWF